MLDVQTTLIAVCLAENYGYWHSLYLDQHGEEDQKLQWDDGEKDPRSPMNTNHSICLDVEKRCISIWNDWPSFEHYGWHWQSLMIIKCIISLPTILWWWAISMSYCDQLVRACRKEYSHVDQSFSLLFFFFLFAQVLFTKNQRNKLANAETETSFLLSSFSRFDDEFCGESKPADRHSSGHLLASRSCIRSISVHLHIVFVSGNRSERIRFDRLVYGWLALNLKKIPYQIQPVNLLKGEAVGASLLCYSVAAHWWILKDQ